MRQTCVNTVDGQGRREWQTNVPHPEREPPLIPTSSAATTHSSFQWPAVGSPTPVRFVPLWRKQDVCTVVRNVAFSLLRKTLKIHIHSKYPFRVTANSKAFAEPRPITGYTVLTTFRSVLYDTPHIIFYTDYYLFSANSLRWRHSEVGPACVAEEHVWSSACDSILFFGCVCASDFSYWFCAASLLRSRCLCQCL